MRTYSPVSGRTSQPLIECGIHGSSCLGIGEIGICTYHNRHDPPGYIPNFTGSNGSVEFQKSTATRTVPSNGFTAQSKLDCHISRHHIFQRNPASIQSFGLSLTRIAKHSSASILLITTILQSESNLRVIIFRQDICKTDRLPISTNQLNCQFHLLAEPNAGFATSSGLTTIMGGLAITCNDCAVNTGVEVGVGIRG